MGPRAEDIFSSAERISMRALESPLPCIASFTPLSSKSILSSLVGKSNKLNNDLLKQHISKALEKVGQGRTDKNGYPIEIDFNELPMLVHMR